MMNDDIIQEFLLEAVHGCNIQLIFESFYTESCCDYVEVTYEWKGKVWNTTAKYSGTRIPGPFISYGNTMTVRFHTDDDTTNRGFSAVWTEI